MEGLRQWFAIAAAKSKEEVRAMKTWMRSAVAVAFIICFSGVSLAQWQQVDGSLGGWVTCLATSNTGAGATNLFAGTGNNGLLRSTDRGATWVSVLPVNAYVYCVVAQGSTIVTSTSDYSYVSHDNGTHWSRVLAGSGLDATALAISDTDFYAATFNGVYFSSDDGNTWSNIGLSGSFLTGIAALRTSSGAVDLFTSGGFPDSSGGTFRSTDNGANWTLVSTTVGAQAFASVPKDSGGVDLFAAGGGVYRSTDDGTNWTAVNNGLVTRNVEAITVGPGPNGGTSIYVGTNGGDSYNGVYLSTDYGNRWTLVDSGLTNTEVYGLTIIDSTVFVGTQYGLFKSGSYGTSWKESDAGLTDVGVRAFALLPVSAGDTVLFAGTSMAGLLVSRYYGSTWAGSSLGSNDVSAVGVYDVNPAAAYVLAATVDRGLFISPDTGSTWERTSLRDTSISAFAYEGTDIFAATEDSGVFISPDDGANWGTANTGLANMHVNALTVSGSALYAGTNGGVFVSTNDGTEWTEVSTGLSDSVVNALAVTRSTLFAGTDSGVFSSSEKGMIWARDSVGFPEVKVNALYVSDSDVVAGTEAGVFRTASLGDHWSQSIYPHLPDTSVEALVSAGPYFFAGTRGGIWRTPYQEVTPVQESMHKVPMSFVLSQNYPNPFNPTTVIDYQLPMTSHVSLIVYDVLGRRVETLVDRRQSPGAYSVTFNGANLASGVYFYRLRAGSVIETKKMLLLK